MNNLLLPELRKIQKKEGYVSEEAIKKLSKKLNIPIVKIYATTTFYSQLYTKQQGKYVIEICNSPSCFLNGSINLIKYMEKKLKIKSGQTTKDGKFSLHIGSCIGCCDKAPAMKIKETIYDNLDVEKVEKILKKLK